MKKQLMALALLGLVATPALAGDGPKVVRQVIIDDNAGSGYFSSRLGAKFEIGQFFLPGHGHYRGARLTTMPVPGSPLAQANLRLGDVITRLDGVRVLDSLELENHHLDTTVRIVRAGSHRVEQRVIWIDPDRYFHDTTCREERLRPLIP